MAFLRNFKHIIFYGLALAVLVFILKLLQWKFLIADNAIDVYIGLIAVFFTVLGIWVAKQLVKPRIETVVIEREVSEKFEINEAALQKLNLSNREYEVLQLLAKGYSNSDIAARLYLSVSTIKTHVSNLFFKMDVKNRTQAMEKAIRLKIIL